MPTTRTGDVVDGEHHDDRSSLPMVAWIIAATLAVLLAVVASNWLVLVAVLSAAGIGAVARYGRRGQLSR